MFPPSPLRGALVLIAVVFFFIAPQVPGHAEEPASLCKGLRGKELVLCWKQVDPERARGDHYVFHKAQSVVHLQWHQEHRGMTDVQVTLDHQAFHHGVAQQHKEFHRSSQAQRERKKEARGEKKGVVAPAKPRDAKTMPNKGFSKRRQLRQ